jgi:Xaa-Pro aminopeptidase
MSETPPKASIDRGAQGAGLIDTEAQIDMVRLRGYRLARTRAEMAKCDLAGVVLYDPLNIRYATGTRNMSIHCMHTPSRFVFIPLEGPVTLFEYRTCEHLVEGIETIQEVRPAVSWNYFSSGPNREARATRWADQLAEVIRQACGDERRIGFDHLDPLGTDLIRERGIEVLDGQEPLEHARSVKSGDEIACMKIAVAACEAGMARMYEALTPGITENQLWAILHEVNIANGGEWIETRLLASGPRTNPWMQECSDKIIRPGELVAFDTDLVGAFGYCADISRTWFCGPGKPTDEQKRLYRIAWEQIEHNMAQVKAGMTFRELSERGKQLDDEFAAQRYVSMAHGVGLADEYPVIAYPQDFGGTAGYDGVVEENMCLCFESYTGAEGGREGVKLEQQVRVTETGCELLSVFPYEDCLLN